MGRAFWSFVLFSASALLNAGPVTFNIHDQEKAAALARTFYRFNGEAAAKAYITDWNLSVGGSEAARRVSIEFATELYKKQPNFDAGRARELTRGVQEMYDRHYGEWKSADFQSTLEDLKALGNTALGAEAKPQVYLELLKLSYQNWERQDRAWRGGADERAARGTLGYNLAGYEQRRDLVDPRGNLYLTFELAQTSPALASVLDDVLKDVNHGARVDEKVTTWRGRNAKASDSLKLSGIDEKISTGLMTLGELRKAVAGLADRVANHPPTSAPSTPLPKLTDAEKKDLEIEIRRQFLIPNFALRALSQFVVKGDRVGQGYIVVVKFLFDMELDRKLSAAGLLSAIAKRANFYSLAATSLFELARLAFDGDQRDLVLEQVVELRKQINELRNEMREQFQAVHQALAQLDLDLNLRFDALERMLRGQERAIEPLLAASLSGIDRLEQKQDLLLTTQLRQAVGDLRASEIQNEANACLLTPASELDKAAYFRAMNRLYTCATHDVFDFTSVGGEIGETPLASASEDDFLRRMAAVFSSSNPLHHMYSLQEASRRYLTPLATAQLANPISWAVCADHFVKCAGRRPDYWRAFDPTGARLSAVIQPGEALQTAVRQLTKGTPGRSGFAFYSQLLHGYRETLRIVRNTLLEIEEDHRTSKLAGYNAALGANQRPSHLMDFKFGKYSGFAHDNLVPLAEGDRDPHSSYWDEGGNQKNLYRVVLEDDDLAYRSADVTLDEAGNLAYLPGEPLPWAVRFMPACPNRQFFFHEHERFTVPDGIEKFVPKVFRVAQDLGMGRISICMDYVIARQTPADGHSYPIHSEVLYRIVGTFNGEPIFSKEARIPNQMNEAGTPAFLKFRDDEYRALRTEFVKRSYNSYVDLKAAWEREFSTDFRKPPTAPGWEKDAFGWTRHPQPSENQPFLDREDLVRKQVTAQVERKLKDAQETFTRQVRIELAQSQTVLGNRLRQINGARGLFQAFLQFGLPRTLSADPVLQKLLIDEPSRLLDEKELRAELAALNWNDPVSELEKVIASAQQRANALEARLQTLLDVAEINESQPLVEETLGKLILWRAGGDGTH